MKRFWRRVGIYSALVVAAIIGSLLTVSAVTRGTEIKTVEAYSTFESIGLRLSYEGDSNSNATAAVRYRLQGQADWRQALPLERISGHRFAGSVFFLLPGRNYEVEITLSDPDDSGSETRQLNVATRRDSFPLGGGKEYYVSPEGPEDGDGTLLHPFRTIQRAASRVAPGDVVWIMPGLYRESVEVTASGKPKAYIAFKALGKGVILSGADSRYEEDLGAGAWQAEAGRGAVYCTEPGYATRYVAADGERLFHYLSRDEFDRFVCGAPGGWYQEKDSGRLYLRLTDSRDPNSIPVQVAQLEAGFHLKGADCILIQGLEVRDYGRATYGSGIHLEASAWNVIRECSIHGMNAAVLLEGWESEGNLVEDCELWDSSIPRWPWAMTKGRDEEGAGVISYSGGRGNVVRACRIHTLFDGLSPAAESENMNDERRNSDWDVCDNEIFDMRDDVIEPEGPCLNFRIWNNYCHEVFSGVSLAPIIVGPVYVMYNVIANHGFLSLKYNGVGPGVCNIFQNTIYTSVPGVEALRSADPITAQHFRNNVFYGDGLALNAIHGLASDNDWDYDLWYNRDVQWLQSYVDSKEKRLFQLDRRTVISMARFQDLTGLEKNGLYADPLFVDPQSGDFRLRPVSPAIDRGVVIPNVNDGFRGKAPDLGAYEWGSPVRGHQPLGTPLDSGQD